jgi:hypothetical protein
MRAGWSHRLILGLLFSLVLGIGSACAAPRGRVFVRVGPPAPIVEVRAVAPGPHFVWIAGYHRWDGRAYAWVPGRWAAPPRARAVWVPGRWVHERRGWYFVDGHWR